MEITVVHSLFTGLPFSHLVTLRGIVGPLAATGLNCGFIAFLTISAQIAENRT